jgi:hypothetical protein
MNRPGIKECTKCRGDIPPEELRWLNGRLLCEDCYLDAVASKTLKVAHGQDSADFMRRLKETHTVIKQKFD